MPVLLEQAPITRSPEQMKNSVALALLLAFVATLTLLLAGQGRESSNKVTHRPGIESTPGATGGHVKRTPGPRATIDERGHPALEKSGAADRFDPESEKRDTRALAIEDVADREASDGHAISVSLVLGGAGREHIEGATKCTVRYVDPSSGSIEMSSHEFDGSDLALTVPQVPVQVAAWTECGLASEAVAFTPIDGLRVVLPALTRSEFEFEVLDYATAAGVSGCSIQLRRRLDEWQEPGGVFFATGPDGVATVSARFGANEIWITKDGYTDFHSIVELPRPPFEDSGTQRDYEPVQYWLDRPFELQVRLEGWEQLGPIGDFGVGGPPNHERTPFNVEGLATLQIEYGFHPLPLKLWTASGGTGIYYLDSAFPENGETYVIDLDAGSNVSVDLRLSDEVEAELADSDCVLSVNYRTDRGDAVTRGPSTTVSGVYEIPGVQAGAATVSFDMNLADGRVGSCAFADIEVSEGADATCVLNVESLPVPVTVRGLNESPVAHIATEVVPRGFRTPWVTGGTTDEEGRVFLPSSGPEDLLFRAVWDRTDGALVAAIDVPMRLHEVTDRGQLRLAPFDELRIQLQVEGDANASATIQLIGGACPISLETIELRADEEPMTLLLASRSNAWATVDRTNLWIRTRRLKLAGEDVVFRGHHKGELVVAPSIGLGSVWSVEYGESLADWERMDLVAVNRTSEGSRTPLPAGWYEVVTASGDVTQRFRVTRGQVTFIR